MTAIVQRPAPLVRAGLAPRTRIWLLTAAIAVTAGLLLVTLAPTESPVEPPVDVPWLVVALAFALAEAAVVHVQLNRESHSFSLTEVVLVVGLYLVDPVALVLAQVVGAGIVFAGLRRQISVKLAFNLALYGLTGCLATITFAAVVGGADPAGSRGWIAALTAVLVGTVVSDLAIWAALSIAEGRRFDPRQLPEMLVLSLPFTLGTAAVALVGMRSLWHDPASLLLLVVPALLILGAYRAFCRARRERANMTFLHQVSTLLPRGGDLEPALAELLAASRSTFRAGVAELTLIGPGGEATTTRSSDGPDGVVLTTVADDLTHRQLLGLIEPATVARAIAGNDWAGNPVNRYSRERGFKDLMATGVTGDRLHGMLLVADRRGDVSTFDEADAALFQTLAHQVGQVLDNGHLEHSLRQVTELKEELAHRACHDPLTGLTSRSAFLERTQHAIDDVADRGNDRRSSAAAEIAGLTVLYLDLDGFKAVNDSLGHDAGDALLQVVASRLRGCVRTGDLVARLGGDEFAVLLGNADHDPDTVVATAERIRARVSEPVDIDGRLVAVGPSIGIAGVAADAPMFTVDELVRRADAAMYAAKRAGGRQHAFYTSTLDHAEPPRYSAADLASAIDQDQITVQYQPIVDLSSCAIVGAEALVRWQHPTDGLLGPEVFIPLAEQTGLVTSLGRRVLHQACRDARSWLDDPGATNDLFISVNLSAGQLADPHLIEGVTSAMTGAGLPARSLVLEITETMLMRDPHAAAGTLERLKDLGVQLAIDDFGTGYSSLAYLRRFPVDMLKIASEFTQGLGTDPDDDTVTHAIIQLAGTLGLRTVAEGIETMAQHTHLTSLSCPLGQGYLFSPAVRSAQMHELLSPDHKALRRLAVTAA